MSVASEKPTPMECLEQGYPMTMARQMDPGDLTREDCVKLLAAEFPRHIIAQKYNYPGGDFFLKLKEWGLNKPPKNWDFKKSDDKAATELGGADPNKAEVERTATILAPAPVQAETIAVPEPPAEEEKPTAIEWLRKYGDAPHLGQIRILALADLTRADAEALLAAGVSKYKLLKIYGVERPAKYYYDKLDAVLQKEPAKEAEIGADQVKTVLTEAEKADLFAEPEPEELTGDGQGTALPPISEAVAQAVEAGELKVATREAPTPEPNIDLAGWEPVSYANRQRSTEPYLLVGAHGYGAIYHTSLQPGSCIQFRLGHEGKRIAVLPADEGQLLYRSKTAERKFTSSNLAHSLDAKGVPLSAKYFLEWNAALGAWIGELAERSGE